MKKFYFATVLFCLLIVSSIVYAGINPIIQSPYTTNTTANANLYVSNIVLQVITDTNRIIVYNGAGLTNLQSTNIVGLGTAAYSNSSAFVGTNAFVTTNALFQATLDGLQTSSNFVTQTKFDSTNALFQATLDGLQTSSNFVTATVTNGLLAATNGTAYNLTIASGNGGGLTNLQSTNIVGSDLTLALDVANSESSSVISEQAGLNVTHLENATNSYMWGAGGGAIFSQLLYSSSITNAAYSGSGIFSGIHNSTNVTIYSGGLGCLVNAGTQYTTNSVLNANQGGLIQGFLYNATDVFLTSRYGAVLSVGTFGSSNIIVDAQSAGVFVQANGANSSINVYRSVVTGSVPSNSTNTFTNTIAVFQPDGLKYALLGSTASNGRGLTNLQSTNIVFQDYDWLSGTGNSDDGGTMTLNNGYQRHFYIGTYGNTFLVTDLISPSGKPSWGSLKIYNSDDAPMLLSVVVSGARPIGSGTPANGVSVSVPAGKIAWLTIHNDGQGTAWSITYAVAIEP